MFTVLGDLSGTLEIGDQRVHADVRQVRDVDGRMAFAPLWFFGAFAPR